VKADVCTLSSPCLTLTFGPSSQMMKLCGHKMRAASARPCMQCRPSVSRSCHRRPCMQCRPSVSRSCQAPLHAMQAVCVAVMPSVQHLKALAIGSAWPCSCLYSPCAQRGVQLLFARTNHVSTTFWPHSHLHSCFLYAQLVVQLPS